MALLPRVLQKIFGSTGATSEFGEIGSQAAGSATTTKDLATIQSLSQFLEGLYSITNSAGEPPRIQDLNSLYLLITSQLKYLFQEGIAEYSSAEDYYTGSICQVAGVLYTSKTGTDGSPNTGNAVSDTNNWKKTLDVGELSGFGNNWQTALTNNLFTVPVLGLGGGNIASNSAFGAYALYNNTTGSSNSAFGYAALNLNTTGSSNSAFGTQALQNNTTGSSNSAFGAHALNLNTTGYNNSAFGSLALQTNTTGSSNSAFGTQALQTNTTGSNSSAFGTQALQTNTTGSNNSAFGTQTLQANTIGYSNSAFGSYALQTNTTGYSNSAFGAQALNLNTTGNSNSAFGAAALQTNTTGYNNSAFGSGALQANTAYSDCSGLGYNAQVTGSNQVQLGDSATATFTYGVVQNRSDKRDKADIRDTVLGLAFITALHPVDYKWNYREDYKTITTDAEGKVTVTETENDGSKKRSRYHHGLIAQEVKAVIDLTGVDFGGYQDHSVKGGSDVLSIGYAELIAPMIKAIQEMDAKIKLLEGAK